MTILLQLILFFYYCSCKKLHFIYVTFIIYGIVTYSTFTLLLYLQAQATLRIFRIYNKLHSVMLLLVNTDFFVKYIVGVI